MIELLYLILIFVAIILFPRTLIGYSMYYSMAERGYDQWWIYLMLIFGLILDLTDRIRLYILTRKLKGKGEKIGMDSRRNK